MLPVYETLSYGSMSMNETYQRFLDLMLLITAQAKKLHPHLRRGMIKGISKEEDAGNI